MVFAKTFDKVPHRRLLYKLEYYGITAQSLNWISAFLSNRIQTVVIDGKTSNTVPVTSGVPQVAVLGLVLFLAYINDLPDYLAYSKLRLFAGDSIIYTPVRSQWLKNSRLILMRQQYGKGIVISAKYLGNTLQSNIKVDKHINDITSNENKALGFLKRKPEHQMSGITSTCPTKTWVLLYSLGPSHSRFYIQN